jgi:hypothetical protein
MHGFLIMQPIGDGMKTFKYITPNCIEYKSRNTGTTDRVIIFDVSHTRIKIK